MGKQTVRKADRYAGIGCQKKRMLPCNREDRDSNFVPPERGPTSDWSKITRNLNKDINKGELEMLLTGTAPLTHDWNSINWNKVSRRVRQIQTRIVKYLKQGKMWQVKKLQRLLRHSFSAALKQMKRTKCGCRKMPYLGLSRQFGNLQVRFLEERETW